MPDMFRICEHIDVNVETWDQDNENPFCNGVMRREAIPVYRMCAAKRRNEISGGRPSGRAPTARPFVGPGRIVCSKQLYWTAPLVPDGPCVSTVPERTWG